MTTRFQELFEEKGGEPIEFEGREVHGAYPVSRMWAWSGVLIEEQENGALLRCSSGYEGPDFASLVLRVSFRVARG